MLLPWEDEDPAETQEIRIADHHTWVVIAPGVKQALKNIGSEIAYLVAFRSPTADPGEAEARPALLTGE